MPRTQAKWTQCVSTDGFKERFDAYHNSVILSEYPLVTMALVPKDTATPIPPPMPTESGMPAATDSLNLDIACLIAGCSGHLVPMKIDKLYHHWTKKNSPSLIVAICLHSLDEYKLCTAPPIGEGNDLVDRPPAGQRDPAAAGAAHSSVDLDDIPPASPCRAHRRCHSALSSAKDNDISLEPRPECRRLDSHGPPTPPSAAHTTGQENPSANDLID
ncbi:hypothetical protein BC828DRAFT_114989 [Blastocladiella britannica]|nr:hypothetical protein BC828DRAFT_114989 [Blastocladiella britannica]